MNDYANPYKDESSEIMPYASVPGVWNLLAMILFPVSYLFSLLSTSALLSADAITNLLNGQSLPLLTDPVYNTLSMLGNILTLAILAFIIVDIVLIHQRGYKILGLILFAILLRPGYFLWRAHLLHKPKAWYIVYTVGLALLLLFYIGYIFLTTFQIVMQLVPMM